MGFHVYGFQEENNNFHTFFKQVQMSLNYQKETFLQIVVGLELKNIYIACGNPEFA